MVGLTSSIAGLLVISFGIIRWLLRRAKHWVEDYLKELKPNGGGSMKDAMDSLYRSMGASNDWQKEASLKFHEIQEHLGSQDRHLGNQDVRMNRFETKLDECLTDIKDGEST